MDSNDAVKLLIPAAGFAVTAPWLESKELACGVEDSASTLRSAFCFISGRGCSNGCPTMQKES